MIHTILKDLIPIIEDVAPTLATMIGSPLAGGATSLILHLLAGAFGFDPTNPTASISDIIKNDSNCKDKLLSIESMLTGLNPTRPLSKVSINIEWADTISTP